MQLVPRTLLGRVGSVVESLVTVASLLSMLLAGVLGDAFGSRPVFLWGGLILLAVSSYGVLALPARFPDPALDREQDKTA